MDLSRHSTITNVEPLSDTQHAHEMAELDKIRTATLRHFDAIRRSAGSFA